MSLNTIMIVNSLLRYFIDVQASEGTPRHHGDLHVPRMVADR